MRLLPSGRISSAILLVFLVLLGLKLTGQATFSYWIVLLPLIVACALGVVQDE